MNKHSGARNHDRPRMNLLVSRRYINANGLSMALLRNAARAIFVRLVFENEKACTEMRVEVIVCLIDCLI